jgi:hypothetical protein
VLDGGHACQQITGVSRRDPGAAYYFTGWVVIFTVEAAVSAIYGVIWMALIGVLGVALSIAVLVSRMLFDDDSLFALVKLPGRLCAKRRGE